jgi:hypothetical protein
MTLPGAIETRKHHHARLDDLKEMLGYERTGHELVITTVRNHWDAVASWWVLNHKPTDFAKFIRTYEHSFYARGNRLWWLHPGVDYAMKYETLAYDLEIALMQVDLPQVVLTRENVTAGKDDYRTYYNKESYLTVWERFKQEIIFYGYQPGASNE